MGRAYSNDLRERVVSAVRSGESCRSVAARFEVSVSTVVKWHQRYRKTGGVAPGKIGGHRPVVLAPHRALIVEEIERTPHLTVRGLTAILKARGILVSRQAVWRFLRAQGLSFKKNDVRS